MFHWKCEREKEREDGHTLHHHRAQLGAIQHEEALGWSITFISTTTFTHLLMKYGIFLHGEPLVFKPSRSYHLGSWKTSVQEASRGKGVVTRWGRWAFLPSTEERAWWCSWGWAMDGCQCCLGQMALCKHLWEAALEGSARPVWRCYRGLLGSQRLTGLTGSYPVTLSKIIRVS